MASLLDQYGKPIRAARLRGRPTLPSLAQVRNAWTSSSSGGLTPLRLADILRRADEGDPNDYLTHAADMEVREPHYAAVLSTRKLALHGLHPVVEAASEKESDTKIAEEVQESGGGSRLPRSSDGTHGRAGEGVRGLRNTLGNDLGEMDARKVYLARSPPVRVRRFRSARHSARGRRNEGAAAVAILRPHPQPAGGIAHSGRAGELAVPSKITAVADWAAFCEVFGLPLRVGRYSANATEEDIRALLRALANLGSDGAAALPEGMNIEFVSASGSGSGEGVFSQFGAFLDAQISKAILGQTMTSDDGSSLTQAEVHDRVRHDILQGDSRQLFATISRDLIDPFVRFNWAGAEPPNLSLPLPNKQDPAALVAALEALVPMGLQVESSEMRARLGLPEPAEGSEVLRAPASSPPTPARTRSRGGAAHLGAQTEEEDDPDEIDKIEDDMLGEWVPIAKPLLRGARTAVRKASSYDDLGRKLEEVRPDSVALGKGLRAANMAARAKGDG